MLSKRKLGREGLEVSAVGLGCMGMTSLYGTPDDAESVATVHCALELGVTYLDTAEMYGPFRNEELLGKALKGRRGSVVLATKFGFDIVDGKVAGLNSRPEHIPEALDGSLSRLGTDYVDVLYQHRVDPSVPIEEVAGAVSRLIEAGKVRYFGMSEAGANNIRRANAACPVSVLQSEYSLWERNLETEIIPVLRDLGIGLVPFSPLGRGFLTGAAKRAEDLPENDYRRVDPRYQGENYDRNIEAARLVAVVAERHGVKPGQIALAWLLAKREDIVPIPGTKRRSFLKENVAAASLELSREDMAELDLALAPEKIAGARYGSSGYALIDR